MHRFAISLSDVDRGVFEELDLRVVRHPSETAEFLVTRVLALCLFHSPGIRFAKGGLSDQDEPPVLVENEGGGRIALWIDVGTPSRDRLERATKRAERVVVVTHKDPRRVRDDIEKIGRPVDVVVLPSALIDALVTRLASSVAFSLTRTDGTLYLVLADGTSLTVTLTAEPDR
jgi:uncharacterized protein YaeQ